MWDDKYNKEEFHYGLKPNDFLVETRNHWVKCSNALCLGAGEGRNEIYLLENNVKVLALDLSKVGLEKFNKLALSRGLSNYEILCSRIEDVKFGSQKFDLITAIWFHGDKDFKKVLFQTVQERLNKGGFFIMEVYTPEQLKYGTGGPPSAEMMYCKSDVESDLKGFEFYISEEVIRDVKEGVGHSGQSSVLRVCAKKLN